MGRSTRAAVHLGGSGGRRPPRAARAGGCGPRWDDPARARSRCERVDGELARATELMAAAPDEARALLEGFAVALPTPPPDDPFSAAYREWTWELYRRISGRPAYDTVARGLSFRPGGRPGAAVPLPERLARPRRP